MGSGKSSLDEVIAEENFKQGHTILDLHSAGNYESLYWVMNKNCEGFWKRWKELNAKKPDKERQKEPLHYNCNTRYRIILVVPDYVQIDEDALDTFNGRFYTKREWAELGNLEYGKVITKDNGEQVIQKPTRGDYVQWIKVRKIHVPNKGYKNRDLFITDLTGILLEAQKERRIVTLNPVFFKDVQHKLVVLEKILRELPEIIRSNFKTMTPRKIAELRGVDEPVKFSEWTPLEKNRHRVTILMREFGSLVASSLTEERNQVIVKKAVFAMVKIMRHFHLTLIGDMQRSGDVLSAVRDQRDYFLWRCSNIDIVSEDYKWLKDSIKAQREALAEKIGIGLALARYPNMEDLKHNQMYVLYPQKNENGNLYKLFAVRMPHFHHHQQDDDFEDDTGLIKETTTRKGTWRFVVKDSQGDLVDSEKDKISEDKKVKTAQDQSLFEVADKLTTPTDPNVKKMSAQEAYEHLIGISMIPADKWTNWRSFAKWLQRYRKKVSK